MSDQVERHIERQRDRALGALENGRVPRGEFGETRRGPAFPAFYDAHQDVAVVSDAYPKAAAVTFHANYAPSLSAVQPASQPAWYIVRGSAAPGQIAVLGSEPGESDYSRRDSERHRRAEGLGRSSGHHRPAGLRPSRLHETYVAGRRPGVAGEVQLGLGPDRACTRALPGQGIAARAFSDGGSLA